MASVVISVNERINNHMSECAQCKGTITTNVSKIQLLMHHIANDYGYYGYITPDETRLFERTSNVLRKRIARIHN